MALNRKNVFLFIILAMHVILTGCNLESLESEESVKQKVIAHLLSKGYKEADFNIDVNYNKMGEGKMGGPYTINVAFNDESNIIYNYKYNYKAESKDITQIGISSLIRKVIPLTPILMLDVPHAVGFSASSSFHYTGCQIVCFQNFPLICLKHDLLLRPLIS